MFIIILQGRYSFYSIFLIGSWDWLEVRQPASGRAKSWTWAVWPGKRTSLLAILFHKHPSKLNIWSRWEPPVRQPVPGKPTPTVRLFSIFLLHSLLLQYEPIVFTWKLSQHYAKWNKSDWERQIYHTILLIYGMEVARDREVGKTRRCWTTGTNFQF